MKNIFEEKSINADYDFIRNDIKIILDSDTKKDKFFSSFREFFLDRVYNKSSREKIRLFLDGNAIDDKEKNHLKTSLNRIFLAPKEHFKGTIGEMLLCFYYQRIYTEFIWDNPPKARSSAEPGIDYVVFVGNENELKSIKFIYWETKTTQNNASTRVSKIVEFFNKGSFDENINAQILEIEEKFENKPENNLKEVVKRMLDITIQRKEQCVIGACGISSQDITNIRTFSVFTKAIPELTKNQREVKIFILELLKELMTYLEDEIWKKLL